MTSKELEILTNIIGGVESGGQIYGNQNYATYSGAYKSSPNEHTCTLGAFQFYGENARRLILNIYIEDKETFRKLDTVNIEAMMNVNWEEVKWDPTEEEANALIAIISSKPGIKCQNELFHRYMNVFIDSAESFGISDVGLQMMWCEIEHLGGLAAATRIFARIDKPMTLDKVYASLLRDQDDKSNDNQVGDKIYQKRHECCVKWIKQYVGDTEIPTNSSDITGDINTDTVEKAIRWMEDAANDPSHGYDQIYRWGQRGDYDCSSAVITAWENAGVPVKSNGATYTGNMYPVFMACGFKDVTSQVNLNTGAGLVRGDVLLNITYHTAMYCGSGMEVEASINEKGTATYGTPGDQTSHEFLIRSYRNYPWNKVLRYPSNYDTSSSAPAKTTLSIGDTGEAVKEMQNMLITCGYSCGQAGADGVFGEYTESALIRFQIENNLQVDGIYGNESKTKLTEIFKEKTAPVKSAGINKEKQKDGIVIIKSLPVRTYAGNSYSTCSFSPLTKGEIVEVCDTVQDVNKNNWYYIKYKGKYGFADATYVQIK